MANRNPFHAGELAAQERAGEAAIGRMAGGAISATIIGGARPFLKQQSMVLLASRDEVDGMWASLVFGRAGFLSSLDGKQLDIDLNQALMDVHDPLWANVERDQRLGSLVIELSTRRRIRINGPAHLDAQHHLWIEVEESYPACPKYITRRQLWLRAPEPITGKVVASSGDEGLLSIFTAADVMFVASRSTERGYDVSHRGGAPGFVQVTGPRTIRWPEFPGNGMFNTVGNLLQDPHAAVVVPDFAQRRVVQLSGMAETLWDQPDPHGETGGTHRFVEFTFDRWREAPLPQGVSEEWLDYSPFNPPVRQGS